MPSVAFDSLTLHDLADWECFIVLSSKTAENVSSFSPQRQRRMFHLSLLKDSWECFIVLSSKTAENVSSFSQRQLRMFHRSLLKDSWECFIVLSSKTAENVSSFSPQRQRRMFHRSLLKESGECFIVLSSKTAENVSSFSPQRQLRMFHRSLLKDSWECFHCFHHGSWECSIVFSSQAAENFPFFLLTGSWECSIVFSRQLRMFHCFLQSAANVPLFSPVSWKCSFFFSSQAAQHAQRDSQEFFQSRFFQEHEDDDDVCTADAIIYQLRANGIMVYVPRSDLKSATLFWVKPIRSILFWKKSFFFSHCACWPCCPEIGHSTQFHSWCNCMKFHTWHHFKLFCHLTQFNSVCKKLLNEIWYVSSGLPVLFEELGSCLLVSVLRWVQIADFLFIHFVSSEHFAIGQDMQHVIIRLNCVEPVGIFFLLYIYVLLYLQIRV